MIGFNRRIERMLNKEEKVLKQAYIDEVVAESFGESMRKYFEKKIDRVVELHDGRMIAIEKPSIQTKFCFGYHDSRYDTDDYDRANGMANHAQKSEEYFIKENMDAFEGEAKRFTHPKRSEMIKSMVQYTGSPKNSRICCLHSLDRYCDIPNETDRDITAEDFEAVRKAYEATGNDFRKRLGTYLKRYGLSKVQSWTYWKDA